MSINLRSRPMQLAIAGLVATNFFWALNAVLARFFRDDIGAFDLNFLRWFFALLILTPFTLKHVKKDWALIRANLAKLLVFGLLGVSFFNFALYQSAHTTLAVNIGLFNSLAPIFTLLLAIPILKTKPNLMVWFGVTVTFTGALLIIFKFNWLNLINFKVYQGDFLMLSACFVWGLYTVLLKKWPINIHPLSLLWITIALGLIVLFAILFLIDTPNPSPFNALNATTVPLVLYTSVFPALLAYLFWSNGVAKIGAPLSSVFLYLNPCFIAIIGLYVLQESLEWFHVLGGGLILAGLLINFKYHK